MNKQQVFDKVAVHLIEQNEKSIIGGSCVYRAPSSQNSKKIISCAVGCLIPDKNYKKTFEGSGLLSLMENGISLTKIFGKGVIDRDIASHEFLGSLQHIHDGYPINRWRNALENFAREHKLNTKALDAAKPKTISTEKKIRKKKK